MFLGPWKNDDSYKNVTTYIANHLILKIPKRKDVNLQYIASVEHYTVSVIVAHR